MAKGKDERLAGAAAELWKPIERVASYGRQQRGQIFADWLEMSLLAHLSRTDNLRRRNYEPYAWDGRYEDAYKAIANRYDEECGGDDRAIDLLAQATAILTMSAAESPYEDPLGQVFMQRITWGEHGQYFTPTSVCEAMAAMTIGDGNDLPEEPTVFDPCCGSGRMLIAAKKVLPRLTLHGKDLDIRCCHMTVLNLVARGWAGHVFCGNGLTDDASVAWVTGSGMVHQYVPTVPPVFTVPPTQLEAPAQGVLFDMEVRA